MSTAPLYPPAEALTVIRLEKVSKHYDLVRPKKRSIFNLIGGGGREAQAGAEGLTKTALEEISLEIRRGEKVAIIGHNGSGKTTLLKLISGFIEPSTGIVDVRGKLQVLMSASAGLVEHMTGKECIKLCLLMNGLSRHQEKQAYEDIVNFVELGEFIDHPVRMYSLGMRARLEFAISTSIKPDILLIDEVLGAGDGYFSNKSAERIRTLVRQSTLLLVTHSMAQAVEFCDRAIWLNEGRVAEDGPAEDVSKSYERYMMKRAAKAEQEVRESDKNVTGRSHTVEFPHKPAEKIVELSKKMINRARGPGIQILEEAKFSQTGSPVLVTETGQDVGVDIRFHTHANPSGYRLRLHAFSEHGKLIWGADIAVPDRAAYDNHVSLKTNRMIAGVGAYFITVSVSRQESEVCDDVLDACLYMQLLPTNYSDPPLLHCPAKWSYNHDDYLEERGRISAWV